MSWSPPGGTLGRLMTEASERVEHLMPAAKEIELRAARAPARASFRDALAGDTVAVIAEIKRRSPSKGDIRPEMDAAAQARQYASGVASAISVLTEPRSFGGSLDDLSTASAAGLPLLRKDFLVHPLQVAEARAGGASAVLLIVRALDQPTLTALAVAAREWEIDALFEVRDLQELARALEAGAALVGVNNRNLETLEIDPSTVPRVVPQIPRGCLAVAESGVMGVEDVRLAASAGSDAVLVGSSISAAAQPMTAVRALTGIRRQPRK
jgi:indole-3-glycerol phosphate synthase